MPFNTTTNAEDDAAQEVATRCLVTELLKNLSTLNPNHVLIGFCLFEWNEEWWGILDINCHPRPAYTTLKELYSSKSN